MYSPQQHLLELCTPQCHSVGRWGQMTVLSSWVWRVTREGQVWPMRMEWRSSEVSRDWAPTTHTGALAWGPDSGMARLRLGHCGYWRDEAASRSRAVVHFFASQIKPLKNSETNLQPAKGPWHVSPGQFMNSGFCKLSYQCGSPFS